MIGVLFFTFFKAVPPIVLSLYEWLVYFIGKLKNAHFLIFELFTFFALIFHFCMDFNEISEIGPLFGIFETMQYTNLVFALAKYIG